MRVRIKEAFASRRFLNRVLLSILTAVTLLVVLLSTIIYVNVEKIVAQNDFKANKKVFSQISYNIQYMDEVIKNLGVTLYLSRDVNTLMNQSDISYYELFTIRDHIVKSNISPNPFVHSIYIYNKSNDIFYSMNDSLFDRDEGVREIFGNSGEVPKLKPVERKIITESAGSRKSVDVLTYFLYGTAKERSMPDSAVILNVNLRWIFDNIKVLNMVDDSKQDRIFIMNKEGELIASSAEQEEFKGLLSEVYESQIKNSDGDSDLRFFTKIIGKKKHVVTYIKLRRPEWILVKLQPYDKAYQHINSIKSSILFITAAFLILAIALSVIISREIYRPVKSLVDRIKADFGSKSMTDNGKDELSLLWNFIDYNHEQLNQYKNEKLSNAELIKAYYLRQLLIDSTSITEEEYKVLKKDHNIALSQEQDFVISIVKIDYYIDFINKYKAEDIVLLKYGMINILTEIFNKEFCVEIVDSKHDEVTIIMNIGAEIEGYADIVRDRLKLAQRYILEFLKISISASIGRRISNIKSISDQYNAVLENMSYRYVYGRLAVITPEMASRNHENNWFDYSFEAEKRLLDELKKGDLENSDEALLKLLKDISSLNHSNITLSVIHLINSLKKTVDGINEKGIKFIKVDFNPLFNEINNLETIDELYSMLTKIIHQVIENRESSVNEKHIILVDTVKEIIKQNYQDRNLCLQYIASLLKLSPVVLGKVFKENTMMSITEYISDVRLNKAVLLLEDSRNSVQQIMFSVGLENESYFYKLFKKKYGVTPKEYVLKKTIQNIND